MLNTWKAAEPVEGEEDERAWLAEIQRGDVRAFEQVFRTYFGRLCDVVYGYVRSREGAEEIVQDLLLKVWVQRERLDVRESLRVYLFRAARNRALNALRRVHREQAWAERALRDVDDVQATAWSADAPVESTELAEAACAAVAALPERRRLAFQLTQQEGMSHASAAAVMGITVKTTGYLRPSMNSGTVSRTRPSFPINNLPSFQDISLSAGDMAEIANGISTVSHHADLAAVTAWRQGGLVFQNAPLSQVVADLGRTFGLRVTIADTVLAHARVTATFSTESSDEVLDEITRDVNARYTRSGAQVTIRAGG